MKRVFPYIVLLAALALASTAAYYSVFGLSKLFSAQATAVIVMASILEASKLVGASMLHRYWKQLSVLMRTYLTTAVFVLMCITSLGIYGFLVAAYQETAYKLEGVTAQTETLNLKKSRFETQLESIQTEKESLNTNINELTAGLANNVITYKDRDGNIMRSTSSATRKVLQAQLDQTTARRDTLMSRESALTDSVTGLEMQVLDLQLSSEVSAEIGPIKYVAQLTNQPTDSVINWFILLFIFVFDPMAVILLVAANRIFELQESAPVAGKQGGSTEESKAKRVKAPTQEPPSVSETSEPVEIKSEKTDIYQEQKPFKTKIIS
jgi:hypothetical protein